MVAESISVAQLSLRSTYRGGSPFTRSAPPDTLSAGKTGATVDVRGSENFI
jgi:hypothetical protein